MASAGGSTPGMNANAQPFVPPWMKNQPQQSSAPFVPAATAAPFVPQQQPPTTTAKVQPLFYDNGQMVRPHHQPHFFGVDAPPLVAVQVGRAGTSTTAPFLPVYDPHAPLPMVQHHGMQQAPVPSPASPAGSQSASMAAPTVDTSGIAVAQYLPRQTEDFHILNCLAQLSRPVVILVLGGRGSGKTTQSLRIAAKYGMLRLCSGDIVRSGQSPFAVLEEVLKYVQENRKVSSSNQGSPQQNKAKREQQAAAPAASQSADPMSAEQQGGVTTAGDADEEPAAKFPGALRGLVLDRFISTDVEPYYLIDLLHTYGLQLDVTINLMMNYETSVARAEARDEQEAKESGAAAKPKKDQRRLLEHATVWAASNILRGYGGLECLEVEGLEPDQVEHDVQVRVDRTIVGIKAGAAGSKRRKPEPPRLCNGIAMQTSYKDFVQARNDVQNTMGTPESKFSYAPFSLMTGLIDKRSLLPLRKFLPDYHVTWKADGERILLVRHEVYGFICFTAKFNAFYRIDPKLIPSQWLTVSSMSIDAPSSGEAFKAKHRVVFIFDAELVLGTNEQHRVYLFDVLYSGPNNMKGALVPWQQRYDLIRSLCQGLTVNNAWTFFAVKEFMPVAQLRQLASTVPPFPTDGVVFQHKGLYKVPRDARIYKWKPRGQCSVDFRLGSGTEDGKRRWLFYPLALRHDKTTGSTDEVPFKNGLVVVADTVVESENLADGVIVECIKTDTTMVYEGIVHDVWQFLRSRPDKAFPNGEDIAEYIDAMEHLTQAELVSMCESACGVMPPTSGSSSAAKPVVVGVPAAAPVAAQPFKPATAGAWGRTSAQQTGSSTAPPPTAAAAATAAPRAPQRNSAPSAAHQQPQAATTSNNRSRDSAPGRGRPQSSAKPE